MTKQAGEDSGVRGNIISREIGCNLPLFPLK